VYFSYNVKVLTVADWFTPIQVFWNVTLYYDVSKNPVTFTFRVKHSPRKATLLGLLDPEGEGSRIL